MALEQAHSNQEEARMKCQTVLFISQKKCGKPAFTTVQVKDEDGKMVSKAVCSEHIAQVHRTEPSKRIFLF